MFMFQIVSVIDVNYNEFSQLWSHFFAFTQLEYNFKIVLLYYFHVYCRCFRLSVFLHFARWNFDSWEVGGLNEKNFPRSLPLAITPCHTTLIFILIWVLLARWTTDQCSFAVHGPRIWKRLGLHAALRSPELTLCSFKRRLNAHLFQH